MPGSWQKVCRRVKRTDQTRVMADLWQQVLDPSSPLPPQPELPQQRLVKTGNDGQAAGDNTNRDLGDTRGRQMRLKL